MKKMIVSALMVSCSVLSFTTTAAQLNATNGVEFLMLNGLPIGDLNKGSDTRLADLPAGQYQAVIQFERLVQKGSGNTRFTSKPYVLNLELTQNTVLDVSVPNIRTESHAAAFFRDPTWNVTNQNTKQTTNQKAQRLSGVGFTSDRNLMDAITRYNQQNNIVLAHSPSLVPANNLVAQPQTPQALQVAAPKTVVASSLAQGGNTLNQLQQLYQQASVEERKAFRRWIIDQE